MNWQLSLALLLSILTIVLAIDEDSPVAIANNITVELPADGVQLFGDRSRGRGIDFRWKKLGGGDGWTLSSNREPNPKVINLSEGAGLFQLIVENRDGESSAIEVLVTVKCPQGDCPGAKHQDEEGKCVDFDCPLPAMTGPLGCRGCPRNSVRKGRECNCVSGFKMFAGACRLLN